MSSQTIKPVPLNKALWINCSLSLEPRLILCTLCLGSKKRRRSTFGILLVAEAVWFQLPVTYWAPDMLGRPSDTKTLSGLTASKALRNSTAPSPIVSKKIPSAPMALDIRASSI